MIQLLGARVGIDIIVVCAAPERRAADSRYTLVRCDAMLLFVARDAAHWLLDRIGKQDAQARTAAAAGTDQN